MPAENDNSSCGIRRLVETYKQEFRQPENTQHYSDKDYAEAERRYVSFRLNNG